MRNELLSQVADLEIKNKQNVSIQQTKIIQQIQQQIKLIDVVDIAQSIMYTKQSAYEYKDKPGKQLVRPLSEHSYQHKLSPMIKDD